MVFTNQSAARAAKEEAQLKKIVQEGMVTAAVEMEKGNAYVTRKIAEKDLYVRKIKAEANLLVQLAEAERVRLKNEALKGIGSERMVGLKMADAYKGLDLIILPSDGAAGVNRWISITPLSYSTFEKEVLNEALLFPVNSDFGDTHSGRLHPPYHGGNGGRRQDP